MFALKLLKLCNDIVTVVLGEASGVDLADFALQSALITKQKLTGLRFTAPQVQALLLVQRYIKGYLIRGNVMMLSKALLSTLIVQSL